jgi:hypothetical protein
MTLMPEASDRPSVGTAVAASGFNADAGNTIGNGHNRAATAATARAITMLIDAVAAI